MIVTERKFGRMFSLRMEEGDEFYSGLVRFVKEKNIRSGLVFILGAFYECDIIPGVLLPSPPMPPVEWTRKHLTEWRDVHGQGYISWPEKEPETLLEKHRWKGAPEPYIHLHMSLSGGPAKWEEVYAGHLCDGCIKGMFVDIIELL
ncbi:MAG: PPC domain-containing DNA-binding protein [Nitrospinota bacterium]